MPQQIQFQQGLQKKLEEVPEEIKGWFGSEKATHLVRKLNEQFDISEDRSRVLPTLILQLEVKEISPNNFVDTLSQQLNVGPSSAKTIAQEIKEELLRPIEAPLAEWGVDIDQIDVPTKKSEKSEGETIKAPQKPREGEKKPDLKPEEAKVGDKKTPKPTPPKPKTPKPKPERPKPSKDTKPDKKEKVAKSKDLKKEGEIAKTEKSTEVKQDTESEVKEDQPFVIHEEGRAGRQGPQQQNKVKKKEGGGVSAKRGGFFKKSRSDTDHKEPEAEIQAPGQKKKNKGGGIFGIGKDKEDKRVVHYSDRRTPLDKGGDRESNQQSSEQGGGKGFINLSKLKPQSSEQKQQKQQPSQQKPEQQNQKPKPTNRAMGPKNQTQPNKSPQQKQGGGGDSDKNNNKNDGPEIKGNIVDLSQ